MARSLVLIKPDAFPQGLVGWIIACFEKFQINDMGMVQMDAEMCRKHYVIHIPRPFYPALEAHMTSGPVVAMHVTGGVNEIRNAALQVRNHWAGIVQGPKNLVHASDSHAEAERELDIWFPYRPIRWNPFNKVVLDHRDGTIDLDATNAVRKVKGLAVPWSSQIAQQELLFKPVH